MDALAEDRLGSVRRDLLDLDAALGARHDDRGLEAPIEDDRGVELTVEVEPLLDEELLDRHALGSGLRGHEGTPHDRAGRLDGLLGGPHQLDAAALSPPTGVDLGLHDRHGSPERGERLPGGLCRVDDDALGDDEAGGLEARLRLVLVELQR